MEKAQSSTLTRTEHQSTGTEAYSSDVDTSDLDAWPDAIGSDTFYDSRKALLTQEVSLATFKVAQSLDQDRRLTEEIPRHQAQAIAEAHADAAVAYTRAAVLQQGGWTGLSLRQEFIMASQPNLHVPQPAAHEPQHRGASEYLSTETPEVIAERNKFILERLDVLKSADHPYTTHPPRHGAYNTLNAEPNAVPTHEAAALHYEYANDAHGGQDAFTYEHQRELRSALGLAAPTEAPRTRRQIREQERQLEQQQRPRISKVRRFGAACLRWALEKIDS